MRENEKTGNLKKYAKMAPSLRAAVTRASSLFIAFFIRLPHSGELAKHAIE